MVLFDTGLNGTPCLSNVDPHSQGMLYNPCFQAVVNLDGPNETGSLPKWEACSSDIMFRHFPTNMVEGGSSKGQEGYECQFLSRCIIPIWWIQSMKDLAIIADSLG